MLEKDVNAVFAKFKWKMVPVVQKARFCEYVECMLGGMGPAWASGELPFWVGPVPPYPAIAERVHLSCRHACQSPVVDGCCPVGKWVRPRFIVPLPEKGQQSKERGRV